MLTDIEKIALKTLNKYKSAIDLLYPDTKYRYTKSEDFVIMSCIMADKFITKNHDTFIETMGSVIFFNISTKEVSIEHNVTINTWIDKCIEPCTFIELIDLNFIILDEI